MSSEIKVETQGLDTLSSDLKNGAAILDNLDRKLQNCSLQLDSLFIAVTAGIVKNNISQAIRLGKQCSSKLINLSGDVEQAKNDFIQNDNDIKTAIESGAVASSDKAIATASKNGKLGKRTSTIETGYNRATRRKFNLPKTYEETRLDVALREGFGVLGTVIALKTGFDDCVKNHSAGSRLGAIAVDAGSTSLTYAASDTVAGIGASLSVGAVGLAAGAIGVAAAPEIVVGAAAVAGAVVAVGALNVFSSYATSKAKEAMGLN